MSDARERAGRALWDPSGGWVAVKREATINAVRDKLEREGK